NDDVAQLCGVTASELGIEAEGFVRLRVKAVGRLYVKADTFDGGFASIYALSSDSVAWREGYDRNSRLSFNGRHLAKDERLSDRTLSAVRRGAELAVDGCVRGSPFTIFVKDLCGRSLRITCYDHYKTEDVKARIEDFRGISPEAQRLCYSIHQLEDGRPLHSYGITGDSTLHLLLRLLGS
ncbi:ubiquitin, partial [Perkinsus olseni]